MLESSLSLIYPDNTLITPLVTSDTQTFTYADMLVVIHNCIPSKYGRIANMY